MNGSSTGRALGPAAMLALALALPARAQGGAVVSPELSRSHLPPWKTVEMALGRSGQLLPGEVFRIALPRTDLHVTVQGIVLEPAFALGSWAAFKEMGDHAMVMGDLVVLERELNPLLSRLLAGGLEVSAIHNHLNGVTPPILYLHYVGHGDAVELAEALRGALAETGTPFSTTVDSASAAVGGRTIDTRQVAEIMGHPGKTIGDDVFQVSVPRSEKITADGMEIPPAMGVAMPFNFQPTGSGKAAITGDFVLTASEVNPVARALREHGIEVTAIHHHMLDETPRLLFLHFWANDDALALARGLRAALDRTAPAPPVPPTR